MRLWGLCSRMTKETLLMQRGFFHAAQLAA